MQLFENNSNKKIFKIEFKIFFFYIVASLKNSRVL